jgi:hypothetical protein
MEFLERQALIAALQQSFNVATFTTMLLMLDKKLENLVAPGTHLQNVETVVVRGEQEGWVYALVDKAHEAVPLSPSLNAFIAAYPEYDPTKVAASIADHLMATCCAAGAALSTAPTCVASLDS